MTKIYNLEAHNYKAEVALRYGMNCTRIACENPRVDVLKTPQDVDVLGDDDAFLFGMPILFFPNRISNGSFNFEGRQYRFPINEVKLNNFCHGTLHKLPFEVTECDREHVKGVFVATDDRPYLTFPHSFEFAMEYRIKKDGVYQTVAIKNTSDKNMPVALGFHTTFNLSDGDTLKIPAERDIERSSQTFLPTGKMFEKFAEKNSLNNGTFEPCGKPISRLFELGGRKMQIFSPKSKATISYIFDEKYKYCMLYSSNGKDHICIEPQTWLTDCPNLPVEQNECGFDFIEPGDVKTYTSVLRVE